MTRLRIVLPGGSGQMGQLLARRWHAEGHGVTVLSRRPQTTPWQTLAWDGRTPGAWVRALEGSDVCLNLTGRSVNCRYTAENRQVIYDSRVDSTQLLNRVIEGLREPPRVWLNASTATIYRDAGENVGWGRLGPMDEATGMLGGGEPGVPRAWDFSVKVAKDWEAALFAGELPRTRRVALRTALTFNADAGSVFAVLSRLVRCGLGGTNGSGQQYVSWIHEADFLRAVEWLIADDGMAGVVNVAAPQPLPNAAFMRALRRAWGVPVGLPAAGWVIELGSWLLRTESELVLKSRRVVPGRLLGAGFVFEYPEWAGAARELVARWRAGRG